MTREPEMLMLSGVQHFAFCRRQWALIHLEQQWADNAHTAQGDVFHARAHDAAQTELRGDVLIMRGLRVHADSLGLSGVCDVVEFHRTQTGISLAQRPGLWQVYPVEYKKGAPKETDGWNPDALQLCAQAMCLEEMLCCTIPEGSLFYGETRRRTRVALDDALRAHVRVLCAEMHDLQARGYTPKVKPHKGCSACSLKEICLPGMKRAGSVAAYLNQHLPREEDACESC